MVFKDYYKILGLETNQVNMEQVRASYREQAKKYHPDVNINNKLAEERFKDINEAYRTLSNYNTKRKYDRKWNTYVGIKKKKEQNEEFKKSSIFNSFSNIFFGDIKEREHIEKIQTKKSPIKGESIETQINITIEEAFYGLNKKISLRTIDGKMKTFVVKIPAGIRNNEKIRLSGQGKMGENGGSNGDLYIKVIIENSKTYRLFGYDIHMDLPLTPMEAALGTNLSLDSIDEAIPVYIPNGIQSGEVIRIAGKGYKDGKGGRGDLVAEIKIMVPKNLTQDEIELYKKLENLSNFKPRKRMMEV